jgi:hypothetical protein
MRYGIMNRCRFIGMAALIALVASLTAQAVVTFAGSFRVAAGKPRTSPDLSRSAAPFCDLRHPVEVRIEALEAPRRGRPLDARVLVSPEIDLSNLRIELLSAGGALPAGATRALLGSVGQGGSARADFSLRLPAAGHRFLLVFAIHADGPQGPISRLATFNVLPDGPADPGRAIVTPGGDTIREYSARRIDQ